MIKSVKKARIFITLILPACLFCACGRDAGLDRFYSEMEEFTRKAEEDFSALNAVDPDSETAVEDMLAAMDELAVTFQELSDMEVPDEFSSIEDLADDAGSYMKEAASLYHEAYADGTYAANVAEAAQENYKRAVKRMEYISIVLQGEMPTDEDVTITTENDAPGFREDASEETEE